MINIFVGNLSFDATADDLRRAFERFGAVIRTDVINDRETQRSRGFGFVEMEDRDEGLVAIDSLDGTEILGRPVNVNETRPREERDGGGSRGGRRERREPESADRY